jgi:D-3-phosphoglycerate dehydrogenase
MDTGVSPVRMDLLIVEPLETEVMQWLETRHAVRFAPELALEPRALRQALYNVRAMIVPPAVAVDAQALHYAPVLRAVGRISAGAENIDLDACARAGVEVVRSLTASAQAEAEFMIGALLSMLRRVPVVGSDGMLVGRELGAATVGLVGMPPAARSMAQMLGAFGSKVVGYDPSLHSSDGVWERWHVRPLGLRELLEQSDAVCVMLSYFSRYQGLLGERFLPFCKPNQVVVSVAHSALFDEAALAEALGSGRVAAAWFDSLEPGVMDPGRPLAGIGTLQITPRVASTTRESRLRSAWAVAKRIDELLSAAPSAVREFRPTEPGVPTDLAAGPVSP